MQPGKQSQFSINDRSGMLGQMQTQPEGRTRKITAPRDSLNIHTFKLSPG